MVEGTGLENRRTGNGVESSNLSLSVWYAPEGGAEPVSPQSSMLIARKRCWDGWPSGLRRTPGKCVYVKAYRGFESHPVRESPSIPLEHTPVHTE